MIDSETANTIVLVRDNGIVMSEPSVFGVCTTSGRVHDVRNETKKMLGHTPVIITTLLLYKQGV